MRRKFSNMQWAGMVVALVLGMAISRPWPEVPVKAGVDGGKQNENGKSKDKSSDDLDVRYAEAYANLAKVRLQDATNANKRAQGTYSGVLIERLQQHAKIAELILEKARHSTDATLPDINVACAEGALKLAEVNLRTAIALNKRVPGFEPKSEVEQLRLIVEVAKLQLERTRQASGKQSTQSHMQWQVNQLRDDLLELYIAFEATALVK